MKHTKSVLCAAAGIGLLAFLAWAAGSWIDDRGFERIVNGTDVRTYPADPVNPPIDDAGRPVTP